MTAEEFLHAVFEEHRQLDPHHHEAFEDEHGLVFAYKFDNFVNSLLGKAIVVAFNKLISKDK